MERLADLLLKPAPFEALMMGNHAIVRAMIEAGVRVATTYPGSPTPEIAEALDTVPKDRRSYHFEWCTNEKVASEVAFGASLNGHLSTVFFKSVGLNVASDAIVQMGLLETLGGIVIVLGDDPGVNSSQNEQDNRHFARLSYIPVFEPASPAEAYRMFLEAASLARRRHMAVFVRLTTHVCHAREVVRFGALPEDLGNYAWEPRFSESNGGPFIPITTAVFPMKRRALAKLAAVEAEAETSPSTRLHRSGTSRRGLITSSLPVLSTLEIVESHALALDVLELGLSYPMPHHAVLEFLRAHDEVLVLEELDRILEQEIKTLAWDSDLRTCRIHGKPEEFLAGELGQHEVWDILHQRWPDLVEARPAPPAARAVVPRSATLCPGCGHRAAFHAIKKCLPPEAITVADIGCHTMGAFEPLKMGQVLLCMGHSNATGAGLVLRNTSRKVVTFIGDSTFYHAGIPAILNAVLHDHDFTLVVLENGTTAMTGHQPHPGTGELGEKIPIKRLLEALGVRFLREVGAYQRDKLQEAMREAMDFPGFAVVIAKHPCMLKFTRERLRKGKKISKNAAVSPVRCKKVYECASEFGCPSFLVHDDGSVTVNPELCIGDGSCQPNCPHQAIGLVDLNAKKEAR